MRKSILLVSAICVIALILLAILIHRASPGPASQEILGVGIGNHDSAPGIVYLSGRRLRCEPIVGTQAFTSACTVEISGKTLEIHASRNLATDPNQLGGGCEAYYDGKQWPCAIGSRHVGVHWFAYIGEPLGLTGGQLEALHRKYFIENLPEQPFMVGMVVVPTIAMLVAMLATAVLLWPRIHRKMALVLLVVAVGVVALSGTFVLTVLLTRGFWD